MELVNLNADLQPDKLIENYSSLIWTERYRPVGDFELKTSDIERTMNLLPLDSFVSLRDSTVPMMVEVYKLEKPKGSGPILTVTGRSLDFVIEQRAATISNSGGKSSWVISAAKSSDAAYMAMRLVLGDVARYQGATLVLPAVSPAMAPEDAIPEVDLTLPADFYVPPAWSGATSYVADDQVTSGTNTDGSPKIWQARTAISSGGSAPTVGADWAEVKFEISPGDLYSAVQNLLSVNHRGIKAVRPNLGDTKFGLEIYNGVDRRSDIVIDARLDQLDESTYLFSNQGSTNVAYIYKSGAHEIVNKTSTVPSGLDRRVLYMDVANENPTDLRSRALVDLYKYNATAIFDGKIAQTVAEGYNTEYFLGDIIKLQGEYGLHNDVRVVEFIRTSDSTGDQAYPAFEVIAS